jgi:predicted ATPase/transcriptional regulator with XRE-family HTH domain
MANATAFGLWLKQQRQARGLPRKELAAAIACSEVEIVKIEGGARKPSHQIAELLAAYFGVAAADWPAFEVFARADLPAHRLAQLSTDPGLAPWRRLASRPHNLPTPPTSFIGRAALLEQAGALLHGPAARLLTLTGPPGVGKTRTALRVAEDMLGEFTDGSWFVPLAPTRDPALVLPALAQALELRESGDQPLLRRVQEYLRDRRLLLVLDNFEQVLPAAPLVASLLEAGPGVKVLVTSRAALHLYGEYELPVLPLPLPDLPPHSVFAQVERSEAVRLFVERAGAVAPGFRLGPGNAQAVAEICVQLEGLPLALELAAARVKTLPVEAIRAQTAQRLLLLADGPIDRTPRQQTLRGAIGWSYDLLAPAERTLFCGLAVFAGGCTLAAVERICGPAASRPPRARRGPSPMPALLAALVAQSLVREEYVGQTQRFVMLETLREYATERLAASGEAPERSRRHLDYYLELAKQAEPALQGPQQVAWLDRLEVEHANLRAALQWALDQREADLALSLASALWHFWFMRSYLGEGRRWLEAALRLGGAPATPERAQALAGLGVLTQRLGEYDQARAWLQDSLALWRALGDTRGIAGALNNLAGVALEMGNDAEAAPLYQESLALFRALGDRPGLTATLHNLSQVMCAQGNYGTALALTQESMALAREAGDKDALARMLITMGEIERRQGHLAPAEQYYEAGLTLLRELNDRRGAALALSNLGPLAQQQGDLPRAEALLRESLRLYQETGDRSGIAFCLGALAGVAGARGHYERAGRLFGASETLTAALGKPLDSSDQQEYDRNLAAVRAQLNGDLLARALVAGRAFTPDEAVDYALKA